MMLQAITQPKPKTLRTKSQRIAEAKRITAITAGDCEVSLSSATLDRDPGSAGHQFEIRVGDLFGMNGEHCMWADDRDGDVATQVVAELRRVARLYRDLAKQIEDDGKDGEA